MDEYLAAQEIEGSYAADKFCDFIAEVFCHIESTLLDSFISFSSTTPGSDARQLRIHHNQAWNDLVEPAGMFDLDPHCAHASLILAGCHMLFLPPYSESPDLTLIEESFSARM